MQYVTPARANIEIVLKITERCNINCSYCYVFNSTDESYKTHPPIISSDTIEHLGSFLADGADYLDSEKVTIDFHGGEPLLIKPERLRAVCKSIKDAVGINRKTIFNLQTNAMLVNETWLEVFEEYQISIGVSLDGPREVNDKERVDHKGGGTYDRTVAGLQRLKQARNDGRIPSLGILLVAQPNSNARQIYRHMTDDLGIFAFDVLLPINSHTDFPATDIEAYTEYYTSLVEEWKADNDPQISIRFIDSILTYLRSKPRPRIGELAPQPHIGGYLFTISSEGDVGPDDSLRVIAGLGQFNRYNVKDHSIADVLGDRGYQELVLAESKLPDACLDCAWQFSCRGGAANGRLVNRYSQTMGFNNPSVVCDTLRKVHTVLAAHAIATGTAYEEIEIRLTDQGTAEWSTYEDPCFYANREAKTIPIHIGV